MFNGYLSLRPGILAIVKNAQRTRGISEKIREVMQMSSQTLLSLKLVRPGGRPVVIRGGRRR